MTYEQQFFDPFYPYQNILQFGYRSTSLLIKTVSYIHMYFHLINYYFLVEIQVEIYSLSIANTAIWLATVLAFYQVIDSVCG